MSISVTTDIILDVARAADPQRLKAAIRKLENAGGETAGAEFAALLAQPDAKGAQSTPQGRSTHTPSASHPAASKARTQIEADPTEAAYRALGGVLLQKTFETAMPDKTASVFGKGVAGSTWKSLLTQHLAESMSGALFRLPKTPDRLRADAAATPSGATATAAMT